MKDLKTIKEILRQEQFENSFEFLKEQLVVDEIVILLEKEITPKDYNNFTNYINETKSLLVSNGMPEENITEGFIGKMIGGAAGFFIGPSVGKIIAKTLGISSGVVYDLLTSRLVGAALGSAITKSFSK